MRFAYLIMAHDNPNQLIRLLKQLDWTENDIFLHLDKKSNCFNKEDILASVSKATIHLYSKFKVYWGDISQTRCQVFLLVQATKTKHDYYHLISGKDFPLKTHKEIQSFFENNEGKEFVHFESFKPAKKENCSHYFIFDSVIVRTRSYRIAKILRTIQNYTIKIQNWFNIRPVLYAGANWYSITHEMAHDFVRNRRKAMRMVRFVKSSDEFVLQTFLMRVSKKRYNYYKCAENDYESIVRKIDWTRGEPYVWRSNDFSELVLDDSCYARKVDENVDHRLLDLLEAHIGKGEG